MTKCSSFALILLLPSSTPAQSEEIKASDLKTKDSKKANLQEIQRLIDQRQLQ
jgi:hypothetical protein